MIILANNSSKEEVNINKLYGEIINLSKDEFINKYNVKQEGLSSVQATERLKNLGPNEIKQSKPKKWYHYFLESLLSPFNCILLSIIAILIYTDIYLPETPSYANIIVITILITASTLLDFFEEYRSNKAAERLKKLVATTTTVIRDNKEFNIPIKDITIRRYSCFICWKYDSCRFKAC